MPLFSELSDQLGMSGIAIKIARKKKSGQGRFSPLGVSE